MPQHSQLAASAADSIPPQHFLALFEGSGRQSFQIWTRLTTCHDSTAPPHRHRLQGATTDAFEWSSESEEAIDRTLSFELAYYATIDTVELQFPTGETYNFDLELYTGDYDPQYTLTVSKIVVMGWIMDSHGYRAACHVLCFPMSVLNAMDTICAEWMEAKMSAHLRCMVVGAYKSQCGCGIPSESSSLGSGPIVFALRAFLFRTQHFVGYASKCENIL